MVITRDARWQSEGVLVADGVPEALRLAAEHAPAPVFVAGGGEIYRAAWEALSRLEITEVHADPAGDVTFPAIPAERWQETARDVRDGYDFVTYRRGSNAKMTQWVDPRRAASVLRRPPNTVRAETTSRRARLLERRSTMQQPPLAAKLGAEFLGTFWLVFGGCGSAVLAAEFFSPAPDPVQLGIGFVGVSLGVRPDGVDGCVRVRARLRRPLQPGGVVGAGDRQAVRLEGPARRT